MNRTLFRESTTRIKKGWLSQSFVGNRNDEYESACKPSFGKCYRESKPRNILSFQSIESPFPETLSSLKIVCDHERPILRQKSVNFCSQSPSILNLFPTNPHRAETAILHVFVWQLWTTFADLAECPLVLPQTLTSGFCRITARHCFVDDSHKCHQLRGCLSAVVSSLMETAW